MLLENADSAKLNTPEVSPSVVPRMALRPLTELAESATPRTPASPYRKSQIGESGNVLLRLPAEK